MYLLSGWRGAGIPVVAERGTGGGWSILGEYRTDLTGLNESEIQSLFVTQSPKVLADLKLQKASEGALLKLLAALPAIHRHGAERARQRIYIDSKGWSQSQDSVPLLPILQDAVWNERKIKITYERGPGCEAVERVLDPLGLVAKGNAWYLVAGVDEYVRSYRIARISSAEILTTPSQTPSGFDLGNYWEKSAETFKSNLPSYVATFRVSPSVFPRLRFAGRFARVGDVIETCTDGWLTLTVGFDVEEMACEYALGFGANLEVLEPAALRMKVGDMARKVLKLYEANNTEQERSDYTQES